MSNVGAICAVTAVLLGACSDASGPAFPDVAGLCQFTWLYGSGSGPKALMVTPDTAWVFHESTPRRSVAGWLQGAALRVGKGRVAMFGEAAMFSAQLGGPQHTPMGMNAPVAAENPQFLLNVLHWLTGLLKG